ncbi:MAG: hypothetical protein AAF518_18180, partial [Spirochaetota bacterium]
TVESFVHSIHSRTLLACVKENNLITKKEIQEINNFFYKENEKYSKVQKKARNDFNKWFLINWKCNQFLLEKYGGNMVLSAFGFHQAAEAERKYLQKLQQEGKFKIYDKKLKKEFWQKLNKEKFGDGVVSEERGKEILDNPPWKK